MAIKLDPEFSGQVDQLIIEAIREGVIDDIELVSGYRSTKEQKRLHERWQRGETDLPAAAPGTSYHEVGLAVDVAVSPAEALGDFGEFAESRGFRWGGRFDDPVHIDAGNWISLDQAKRAFRQRDLVGV